MIKYIKENITNALLFVLVAVFLWISITTTIQRLNCKKMSQTELFLHIPKSFIWNYKYCN